MTASSSNKEMFVDRLSALPDGILCYILSFLEMKEASITCLLSKRWQFLWTKLPGLQFMEDRSSEVAKIFNPDRAEKEKEMERTRKFVNRVHKTLVIYSRHNLERFKVNFRYTYDHCFASDVNVWIGFSVENKVKNVILILRDATTRVHTLPQMMYSNSFWTSLTLRGCTMYPRGTIQWQSLTMLRFYEMELNEHTFEKIFLGCPVLSSFEIVSCWGFDHLEVNSPSLGKLRVEDKDGGGGDHLEISAPYLHALTIVWDSVYINVCLKNMKSLVIAEIDDSDYEWEDPDDCVQEGVKDILGSIRHVKMLHLGPGFTEILSLIAWNWQLPQSATKYLELRVIRDRGIFSGIELLLESSPNLETLVIHGCAAFWAYPELIPASKNDLNCHLFYLKTVRIKDFGNPNHENGEPMLTLARILLKRAVVLEKMVIDFQGFTATSSTAFYEMTRELLSYPRISQKAVVLFC